MARKRFLPSLISCNYLPHNCAVQFFQSSALLLTDNRAEMLAKTLTTSLVALHHVSPLCFSSTDLARPGFVTSPVNGHPLITFPLKLTQNSRLNILSNRWKLQSTALTLDITLSDEDTEKWAVCRESLSAFDFSPEEQDKILGKAFGQVRSPYWGEERKPEIPNHETVNGILEYLRSLSLSDDDLSKLLKKFPEVLGCSLENELKNNVGILEKQWGITGKPLRNVLLRNPKLLGYNVDCKGDCVAQCTRCWARF